MTEKPSRNSPCACGSGKKYKKCCGKGVAGAQTPNWNYCNHAVAFLDLMGQRHVFDNFPGVPETEEDKAVLYKKLGHTVGYIQSFRKGFKNMFGGMTRERPIPQQVPQEFHPEWRLMQATDIHLQSVSDAVVAWTPIFTPDEPRLAKSMNGLWGMMISTAGMTLHALASKHALRGGIEVDTGIRIEAGGDEIYGRALNTAYELESKEGNAESPRVLVGSGAIKLIDSILSDPPGSRYVMYAKLLAERCKSLIVEDEDGKPIVHFLGPGAREVVKVTNFGEIAVQAEAFVREATLEFKDDEKLGPRYARLLRYFDEYLPEWRAS